MTVQNHYSELLEITKSPHWTEEIVGNNRIILRAQESLSEIYSIKKMCITIAMGRIVLLLDDQAERVYSPGSVIEVPGRTKIRIRNLSSYKSAMLFME